MEEEKPTEQEEIKPRTLNMVEQAQQERILLEKTLEELRKERQELEILKANEALSGETGGHVENKPKEIDPIEYAKKAMAGELGNEKEE